MASYTVAQAGDWDDTNTWNESGTPGSGDDVTIDNYKVTMTQAETAGSVVIDGGELDQDGYKLTLDNDVADADLFIIANVQDIYTPNGGEVELTGSGNVENPHWSNDIDKLTMAANGKTNDVTGDCRVSVLVVGTGTVDIHSGVSLQPGQGASGGTQIYYDSGCTYTGWGEIFFYTQSTGTQTVAGFDAGGIGISWFGSGSGSFQILGNFETTGGCWMWHYGDFDTNGYNTESDGLYLNDCTFRCRTGTHDHGSVTTFSAGVDFELDSCTFKCAGTFDLGSGSNIDNTKETGSWSTLIFDGSGAQSFDPHGDDIGHIEIDKSGGTLTMQDQLGCVDFTNTAGTFDSGSNYAIDIDGDFSLDGGTVDFNTSTLTIAGGYDRASGTTLTADGSLTFDGTSGTHTINSGTGLFPNFTVNGTGGTWEWSGTGGFDEVTVTNGTLDLVGSSSTSWTSLTVNANGIFRGGSATLEVYGSVVINSSSNTDFETSTVLMAGSSTSITNTASGNAFYNLEINSSGTPSTTGAFYVDNEFLITAGTFDLNGHNMTTHDFTLDGGTFDASDGTPSINISGDVDVAGAATINEGSSKFVLDGDTAQSIDWGDEDINDLDVTNVVGTVSFTSRLDVKGTFAPGNGAATVRCEFATSGSHYWNAIDTSGASGTGSVEIDSIGGVSQFALTIGSNQTVTSVDVSQSNLTGFTIDATDPTNIDSGSNSSNWLFSGGDSVPQKIYNYRRRRV